MSSLEANAMAELAPTLDLFKTLLRCPLCLTSFTTSDHATPSSLRCGHTVCTEHLQSPHSSHSATQDPLSPVIVPSCPLPTCQPTSGVNSSTTLDIPPSSSVAYYPPVASPSSIQNSSNQPATIPSPRADVTLLRVINLTRRYSLLSQNAHENVAIREEDNDVPYSDSESDDHDIFYDAQVDAQGHDTGNSTSDDIVTASVSSKKHVSSNQDGRPRKKQRQNLSHSLADISDNREMFDQFRTELSEQLTCEVCYTLYYQPVTTPCQHTFCAKCLQRSLDHGTSCPLCRQQMPPFSYFQDHPFNKLVLLLLLKIFPEAYAERAQLIESEERERRLNTPIFVCQLSFPGVPTLLHIFEPRYRLMLRRCLESSNPCFGMIMPPRSSPTGRTPSGSGSGGQTDYGTMLEIRSVQMLPDGRSMVETFGSFRFRILERGGLDGYLVGRIERLDDVDDEENQDNPGQASAPPGASPGAEEIDSSSSSEPLNVDGTFTTTEQLVSVCRTFVQQLRNGTAPWVVQRLDHTYGPMPSDPAAFSFWMALILPIDDQEKAKLLPIKSARLRLRLIVHWIEQLNSNWWFTSGCCIS